MKAYEAIGSPSNQERKHESDRENAEQDYFQSLLTDLIWCVALPPHSVVGLNPEEDPSANEPNCTQPPMKLVNDEVVGHSISLLVDVCCAGYSRLAVF